MPKTKLVKLGNSLAAPIPKAVVAQAGLHEGDWISLKVFNACIELHRVERIPTLDELVAQITPENRHEETTWGPDRGKEIIER